MVNVINFYMDDSGTRHPDHKPGNRPAHNRDWFGLGGVLIRDEEEATARELHSAFMARWKLDNLRSPLHSSDIRSRRGPFSWLGEEKPEEQARFLEELYILMREPPFVGMACVIDRPGYNNRYLAKYGRERWSLCKTAFSVAVERAAKYARSQGYKLKVFPERCDKVTDEWMKGYYRSLREVGMPFSGNMDKYRPMSATELRATLYDFKTKAKSSPMVQMADLYLWPMCIGGYHRSNRTYSRLCEDGKLIDSLLPTEVQPQLGIKYSCWDLVEVQP